MSVNVFLERPGERTRGTREAENNGKRQRLFNINLDEPKKVYTYEKPERTPPRNKNKTSSSKAERDL